MFESRTQENILAEMIEEASDEVSVIEGSFLYNALSLAALALEDAYDDTEALIQNAFPDTCDREHLLRFAQTKGLTPYPATAARYEIECNVTPELGAVLTDGTFNFVVTQNEGTLIVDCEEAGEAGNALTPGTALFAVDYIEGFESAAVETLYSSGEEAEDTETFRARYTDALDADAMYGNQKTYEKLMREAGVTGRTLVSASGQSVSISYLEEDGSIPTQQALSAVVSAVGRNAPLGRYVSGVLPTVTAKTAVCSFAKIDENMTDAAALAVIKEKLDAYFETLCTERFAEDVDFYPATLTAAVMDALKEQDGLDMVSFSSAAGSSGKSTKPAGAMWTNWTVTKA